MRAPTLRRQAVQPAEALRAPVPAPAPAPGPVDAPGSGEEPTDRYRRKREDILAAGALTFNELGIGGGTLADIAKRVGLATNSVTYYYRRKQDLVAASFLRSIAAHVEDIRHAAREPTIAARVEACMVRQAALLADIATGQRPPLVVFSELRTIEGKTGAELHRAYSDMFREMRGLLVGPETAVLSRDDLNARTHILLSAFHMMRASVNRISARLNVTKGSFYHHIEHKDDLILACFERTLTAIRRATAEAQALAAPGWDQACAMARSLACLQASELGPLLRVGALGALPAFDGRAQAFHRMFQLVERMRDLIVTGMMDGSIRPLDSGIAAQLLAGSINVVPELHHWVPATDPHRLVDLYLKPVFEGLLAPPA